MTADLRWEGDAIVLTPRGDLDLVSLPALATQVDRALATGARTIVIDLSSVGILPSTAAGFLLQTRRRVGEAGGSFALVGARRAVAGTLRTMGVDALLRLYPTVEDALRAGGGAEGAQGSS